MMLTADEISDDMVKHAKVFHFGTLSMTHESVRQATMEAVKLAKITGFYGKSAKRNASFANAAACLITMKRVQLSQCLTGNA